MPIYIYPADTLLPQKVEGRLEALDKVRESLSFLIRFAILKRGCIGRAPRLVHEETADTLLGVSDRARERARLQDEGYAPIAEQHRIVAKVEDLMGLCDRLEKQLIEAQDKSSELLEAVLHHALNGASGTSTVTTPLTTGNIDTPMSAL